jgi:hypothetical protein
MAFIQTSSYTAAIQTVHAALPHSRIAILPKQGHEAVVTAPELVVREVIRFFLGTGTPRQAQLALQRSRPVHPSTLPVVSRRDPAPPR